MVVMSFNINKRNFLLASVILSYFTSQSAQSARWLEQKWPVAFLGTPSQGPPGIIYSATPYEQNPSTINSTKNAHQHQSIHLRPGSQGLWSSMIHSAAWSTQVVTDGEIHNRLLGWCWNILSEEGNKSIYYI